MTPIYHQEIVLPSAKRLIGSLRSMGYEFEKAVADIVDNSLEAGATTVWINVEWKGLDSYVCIMDDGAGMSKDSLIEAMRFGTNREYESGSLGKFGLGLKTASIGQCRRLAVASRCDTNAETEIYSWDLDHIEKTDDWSLLKLDRDELPQEPLQLLETGCGTIVFWQKLDLLFKYSPPDSRYAQNGLSNHCRKLENHLAMVFHRFLSGEANREKPFSILVNGNEIDPWDPFARDEEHTQDLEATPLFLQVDDREAQVLVHPYILPTQKQFSSSLAHERAGGPKKWNRQQGLYIYRENRLIQSGGWSHLRVPDEHTKLARIAIDFSSDADGAFHLNVAKTAVQLPDELRSQIAAIASDTTNKADNWYRSKGTSTISPKESIPRNSDSNRNNPPAKPFPSQTMSSKNQGNGNASKNPETQKPVAKPFENTSGNGKAAVNNSDEQKHTGQTFTGNAKELVIEKLSRYDRPELLRFIEILYKVADSQLDAHSFQSVIEKALSQFDEKVMV